MRRVTGTPFFDGVYSYMCDCQSGVSNEERRGFAAYVVVGAWLGRNLSGAGERGDRVVNETSGPEIYRDIDKPFRVGCAAGKVTNHYALNH